MPSDKGPPRLGDSGAFGGEEYAKLAIEFARSYQLEVRRASPESSTTLTMADRLIEPAFADFLARRRQP